MTGTTDGKRHPRSCLQRKQQAAATPAAERQRIDDVAPGKLLPMEMSFDYMENEPACKLDKTKAQRF
ncbi:MAG: hypothetical protein Q7T36_17595 [Fluviicoccus sp.]|uniref:hypothetical protein n=1 Tax=Fluviicoccus sp. TaxID=2003552 RepID=UPI00271F1C1E|nr:hypothetical protein [Fluviicoccus sp.]MDO8332283.1 hypothetical protein [Fluviicoccus sp.]